MRLLAIAPTGFFADYGCHVRIQGHLRALQDLGYQVRLVTYPAGRDLPGLSILRPPLPLIRNLPVGSSRRKLLLDALLGPTALAAALRFRPHILHTYLHEGALLGWPLARLLGAHLSFDYQGSLTAEMLDHHFLRPRSPWLPLLRRLEDWIEQRPQVIFASSAPARDRLQARGLPPAQRGLPPARRGLPPARRGLPPARRGLPPAQRGLPPARRGLPPARLHLLPDSVDVDVFAPRPPDPALAARLGLDPGQPVVVYLGLLAPYQGIDLLLAAIAHPLLAATPAQFLIMGFPDVDRYRAQAQALGVAGRAIFTGAVPYADAPQHLALGDIAVAPKLSTTEGSGKLLPYMSMALPIVATATPVHRAYLGEEGVWAEAPEPEALAQALRWALEHRHELRARGQRLRERAQTHYTWAHAAQIMHETFTKLMINH
ncbi:MAG: glycosyltransferase [Caldilineales bacterium]|nr:glycosyltransferase [Caldilineales bacterium]